MKRLFITIFIIILFLIESCGPLVFNSKLDTQPPKWYYPNRVETFRYIYFPDYEIYYDFSSRNYLYSENDTWLSVEVLPKRFYGIDLSRSKQVRVKNYYGDTIKKYHCENIIKKRCLDTKRYH